MRHENNYVASKGRNIDGTAGILSQNRLRGNVKRGVMARFFIIDPFSTETTDY